MLSYEKFIGIRYDELLKRASFLSLIGGNVPEVLSPSSDAFYISCYTSGMEFKFDRQTNELISVVASNSAFCTGKLKLVTNRQQVREILGTPSFERPEKNIPVLGRVGAMDEYIDAQGIATQVVYKLGCDHISTVHYQRKD
jgi:hypothetical protein